MLIVPYYYNAEAQAKANRVWPMILSSQSHPKPGDSSFKLQTKPEPISKPTISFFMVVQAKNVEKRWEAKSKKTQVPSPKKLIAFWVA